MRRSKEYMRGFQGGYETGSWVEDLGLNAGCSAEWESEGRRVNMAKLVKEFVTRIPWLEDRDGDSEREATECEFCHKSFGSHGIGCPEYDPNKGTPCEDCDQLLEGCTDCPALDDDDEPPEPTKKEKRLEEEWERGWAAGVLKFECEQFIRGFTEDRKERKEASHRG